MSSETVYVYRDKLFLPSESFIQRAYLNITDFNLVYTGHLTRENTSQKPVINFYNYYRLLSFERFLFHEFGVVPRALKQALIENKPRLIHAHFGKSGAYALPLAEALNIPLIVTYHGGDTTKKTHQGFHPLKTYNRRKNALFQNADSLLAVSDFIKQKLIEQGAPAEKIRTHYNGVDPDLFYPEKKENRLVFAGRMVEKKGIDLLVKALLELKQENCRAINNWQFCFLGAGDFFEQAKKDLKACDIQAEFTGWVDADQVKSSLASARLVVIPSRQAKNGDCEGLPMIALEGMMSGAAILASDHAGLPEAVLDHKTGGLFKTGQLAALKTRLADFLSQPKKTEKLGEAGRKRALKEFNLYTQSKKLEALYHTRIKDRAP